jgi:hypothetical protein
MSKDDSLSGDEKVVVKKVYIDPATIVKMKKLSSLYSDEIPEGAKEIDIISFFFNKAFQSFLKSGEIERKVSEITKSDLIAEERE